MGLFDFLTGTKRPDAGTTAVSAEDLTAAILGLNRDSAPYQIVHDDSGAGDLVAEWKIVDATWYEIFAKAGLERVFRIRMKLNPARTEVRAVDEEYSVAWQAGVPTLSLAASAFRGQKSEISFGTAYAFTEELRPGQVYNYRFNTGEMKTPLQKAVTGHGWTWRAVAFGKL
jgi:outer membrane protein TolC